MFNIWTSACYLCARIRQFVGYVHPQTLHSFWMNFSMKLIILIVYTQWIYDYCVCINRSLNPLYYWKAAHVQCLMPYCLAGCGEWIWYREQILHWRLNLHQPFWVCPVSWLEGKKIFDQFRVVCWCPMLHDCKPNNLQCFSRKLLFFMYPYPSKAWQYRLANCTQCRQRKDAK